VRARGAPDKAGRNLGASFFRFREVARRGAAGSEGAATLTLVGFLEAIDISVSNRLVARGEVVLVEDKLGVTMTELIKAEQQPCAS
jgi:hypothetical protein